MVSICSAQPRKHFKLRKEGSFLSELLRTNTPILSVPSLLTLAALAYEPGDHAGGKKK